jgi:CubicO group peptidase (beta-lactamase class C family)
MSVRKVAGLFALISAAVMLMAQAPAQVPASSPQLATLPVTGAAPALEAQDASAFFDGMIPALIRQGNIAGAVVVVVRDGKVVTQKGYGYADVKRRIRVDPETTIFRPGSISKTFTFTLLMHLVETGRVGLDDDVNRYIDFRIPDRDGQPVTIRNLMTHTPGFEEALIGLGTNDPKKLLSTEAYLKHWIPHRIYPAGTTPAYSNYGTTLAGYIVQRIVGKPLEQYLDERIFMPLGMTRSTFRQPLPEHLRWDMSQSYDLATGEPQPYDLIGVAPAGALAASGGDMGRYMIAQLAGDVLLRPETTRAMFGTTLRLFPRLNPVALGFFRRDSNGQMIVEHSGDTLTFHSRMFLLPDSRTGVYVSFNSSGRDYAAGAARDEVFDAFMDRYYPAPARPVTTLPKATAVEHARMMAGTYMMSRRSESSFLKALQLVQQQSVTVRDGSISAAFLQGPGGQVQTWDEIEPFVWKDRDSATLLAADVRDGEVRRFGVDPSAGMLVFIRVPWHESATWLRPALLASMAVLVLTLLGSAAAVFTRRYHGVAAKHPPANVLPWRIARIAAIPAIAALIGWAMLLPAMMSNIGKLDGRHDPIVHLLQIVGTLSFVTLVAAAIWSLVVNWRSFPWTSRAWSIVLAGAAVIILWVGIVFNLVSWSVSL